MSNCVGSSGLGLPASAVAQHGVKRGDHLAHDGDKDDLGLLAGSGETVVECFEGGVVTAGAEGRHVEDVSHRHAAAVYAAMSAKLAAVEIVWRETDEGGDLFTAHATELRQQGDEGESEHGADPRHRGQARVTAREIGLGGDHLGQALVEEADISLDARQAAFGETPQHGVFELCGLVLDCDVLVTELAPHGDDLGDPRGGGVMAHDVRGHGGDVRGDQARIEPIILGEDAAGAGELPKPIRIDAAHREAGGEQGADDAALVAAARLEPDRRDGRWRTS